MVATRFSVIKTDLQPGTHQAALLRAAFHIYDTAFARGIDETRTMAEFYRHFGPQRHEHYVGTIDDEPVFAAARLRSANTVQAREAYIDLFATKYQAIGHGTLFLVKLHETLQAEGFTGVGLRPLNDAASRFYTSHGYESQGGNPSIYSTRLSA